MGKLTALEALVKQLDLPGIFRKTPREDVYHYSRDDSGEALKQFRAETSEDSLAGLGTHVGTKEAALDRYLTEITGSLQHPWREPNAEDFTPMWNSNMHDDPKGYTLPLKARTDKPFTNMLNEPWTESELRAFVERSPESFRTSQSTIRKALADRGYTHIPYINDIEDEGNISYIMLTDRPEGSDNVLRSALSKPDRKATDPTLSILAAPSFLDEDE